MSIPLASELADRLARYAAIETTSDAASAAIPSTETQFDLLRLLEAELLEMGAAAVHVSGNGFLYATIPATADRPVPTIGLLAHVDTVADIGSGPVLPRIHRAWDGSPITFPNQPGLVLSGETAPYLAARVGHDIITASGGTLLGADNKAGVAIIMAVARRLLAHQEIPHGEVRVCFTPDEEIGTGIRHIDLARLGVDFAYTLDGEDLGEVNYETWSGDKATVRVVGVSTHPGTGKDKLVNALTLAAKIVCALPDSQRTPATTAGRDGFIHQTRMDGSAQECTMTFILRDFELDGLENHRKLLRAACETVQLGEPRAQITCEITPQYRNMRYWLEKEMRPVELALAAVRDAGIEPVVKPIRGGTDGSQLTEMGVPTPNLFTGSKAVHSPLEYASAQDMEAAANVCLRLVERAAAASAGA